MIEGARAEGEAKGKVEGKVEMARELLALGVDMSAVVKASGLSAEEIKKLLPKQ
jgi:predicted transposase/invertase (TIGR01784 family)